MNRYQNRGKTLVIYLQGPVKESKSFSKAPGYYHWVLVFLFIYLFIYLFVFSITEFLVTTVKEN